MEKISAYDEIERLSLINSTYTSSHQTPPRDVDAATEDDDEEALSLSDLPIINQSRKHVAGESEIKSLSEIETQDDFDFCSKESEMCTADEVFHQGQILPFRHSVSSGKRLSQVNLSRSVSLDYRSSGLVVTSRSSSISSRQSSSSGSSTATTRKPPLNIFHSHPSPSPKIQGATTARTNARNSTKKSSAWNIFRRGLITTPPKIAFEDLKTRTNCKNFGSRNSTSSNSSSLSSNSDRKKKASPNFLGGCNCALDAVDTVPYKVGFVIKRSMSDSNSEMRALHLEEEALLSAKSAKKRVSNHRTFEWLKQLSIEGTADEP